MATILQVSDTHLSRTHPLFQFNFEVTLREIERHAPDLVVYTGDLSLNGPDNADDVFFAGEQIRRTAHRHFALPGNHDIGLVPGSGHSEQLVSPARRAVFLDTFGYERFAADLNGWRIVGLNSQLMGSGLPGEEEQFEWLAQELSRSSRAAVFMHYPVFLFSPQDEDVGHHALAAAPRRRLLEIFERAGNVRLVATGHLHQSKSTLLGGTRFEWAPSSAFVIPGPKLDSFGGRQVTGLLLHELDEDRVRTSVIEPELIINADLRNWSKASPHGYYQVAGNPWPGAAASASRAA